jgi:hypothetical protein
MLISEDQLRISLRGMGMTTILLMAAILPAVTTNMDAGQGSFFLENQSDRPLQTIARV